MPNMFRALTIDDIEVRVSEAKSDFVTLLLYKTARTDSRILDETVGPMNWQCQYKVVNDNLFCSISIRDEKTGQWISKEDVGVESNVEKEKGQASDAFKRAGFKWGIGVELYDTPTMKIRTKDFGNFAIATPRPVCFFDLVSYESDKETKKITKILIKGKVKGTDGNFHEVQYSYQDKSKDFKKEAPIANENGEIVSKPNPHLCEQCGKEIVGNGKATVEQIISGTKRAYGKQLCLDCAQAAKNQAK